jgi:hypothetical protein
MCCSAIRMRATACALLTPLALSAALVTCSRAGATEVPAMPAPLSPPARFAGDSALSIEMRNVDLHVGTHGTLHVQRLRGQVISATPGEVAVLDDTKSFSVRVTSGRVALSPEDLSVLLNEFVFAYPGAPLKHLRARFQGTEIVQTGVLHKGVDLRFEITATPTLEPDGRIRLHPTKTRILGVNGQKLLHALGLHLDDLLDLRKARGASVKGDDLFLEPEKMLPPPAIEGRLASIRVEGDFLVQEFVRLPEDSIYEIMSRPDSSTPNFVYFRGGQLRFGKLLMTDTDLQIVDADPSDPFDLNLPEYARQLIAGTSRTLANQGLRVEMPDYRIVAAHGSVVARMEANPR